MPESGRLLTGVVNQICVRKVWSLEMTRHSLEDLTVYTPSSSSPIESAHGFGANISACHMSAVPSGVLRIYLPSELSLQDVPHKLR